MLIKIQHVLKVDWSVHDTHRMCDSQLRGSDHAPSYLLKEDAECICSGSFTTSGHVLM